ncbi:MAG: hypothetical protein GWP24_04345 [Alphaproteobacteria bacterium]|nr:hypothetical protein [Alphaproteobacteria bacterium]
MPQISKILKDSDVITTILLLGISFIFYSGSGANAKDWVFPLMATFSLFGISIFFLIKSILKIVSGTIVSDLEIETDQVPSIINVIFFALFMFIFLFLLFAFGFWIASLALLWTSIAYFNPDKTLKTIIKSLLIAIISCLVAYVVFTHIFYVPFPESRLFG